MYYKYIFGFIMKIAYVLYTHNTVDNIAVDFFKLSQCNHGNHSCVM